MARFNSSSKRPNTPPPAPDKTEFNVPAEWNTLAELRQSLISKGCTKAQFDFAVETVGENPYRVANYVQRYLLTQTAEKKRDAK